MSNPKINTTTLNQEEQAVSVSLFLSFLRNPENKLGQRIVLPNDKYFAENMRQLEKMGYVRNPEKQCFEYPQKPVPCPFKNEPGKVVQIADNDSKFIEKMHWLEKNGYERNPLNNCWEVNQQPSVVSVKQRNFGKKMVKITKSLTTTSLVVAGSVLSIFISSL